ncbi:MAG: rod shape-determining protein MreC [Bacteroidales bacterium]|nr:rod shape-determining protein MreC [Bacteroidales bacterium]
MRHLLELLKRLDYMLVFLALLAASIVLMVQNTHYQRSVVLGWTTAVVGSWSSQISSFGEYFSLKAENEKLAAENARLRAHLSESYLSYTTPSFVVDDTVYNQRYTYTEAKVIKNTWTKRNNYLMINKGSSHGVHPDMAVISPQGVVGVVLNCTKNFATVMPVIHLSSQHSVSVRRTKTNGTLQWDGKDYRYATVIDIPTTYKLFKNDTIVTSGMANDFPEGIPVGYVESFDSEKNNGFYEIKIRLSTDFNKLGHVYIVENRFRREQDALIQALPEK